MTAHPIDGISPAGRSQRASGRYPQPTFDDLGQPLPIDGPVDAVLSTATFHWVPDHDALFANLAGNLCEGTGTNVFLGLGGRLVTPPLSAGCLAGVTRDLVMELVDVVEDDIPMDALAGAEEAFLTSSTRDVQPIRTIDAAPLPKCPGPLTEGAGSAFRALMERDLDP